MQRWNIAVDIDEDLEDKVNVDWATSVIRKTLEAENVPEGADVSLVITDDEAVRQLNKTYRGLDEPTDVLSFALTEEREAEAGAEGQPFQFVLPPGMVQLGEVVISYETAERQANERSVPVERELALLIVHGVLHLLGYDHAEKAEEEIMRAKEQTVLSEI